MPTQALESTGVVKRRTITLDEELPIEDDRRVRVILLLDHERDEEQEWLKALASNPAFNFLNDPREDIYTLEDGKPYVPDR
ncbi:MAG: hypothetical protein V2A61_04925 [Calditrichota bacterium]